MSDESKGSQKSSEKAVERLSRGLGKDAHYYVIAAGVVAESLNRRYGLGLTPQEIMGVGGALFVGAVRLKQYLGN